MPTLKLSGTRPSSKPAPSRKRKPAAKTAAPPARKRKPAAKQTPKRKPAAKQAPQAQAASTNGGSRGPKLPEGWTKQDFNKLVKDMQRAKAARDKAEAEVAEAKRAANAMALYSLDEEIQMSVVARELDLSRQWLYTLLKDREEGRIDDEARPIEGAKPKPAAKRSAKQAAKKPAAKKRPAAKAAAKSAPARKRPAAKKAPARKRPAGGGRVRMAR